MDAIVALLENLITIGTTVTRLPFLALKQVPYAPGTAQAHGHSIFTEAVVVAGDSIIAEVLGSYMDVSEWAETPYLEVDTRTPVAKAPLISVVLD